VIQLPYTEGGGVFFIAVETEGSVVPPGWIFCVEACGTKSGRFTFTTAAAIAVPPR
jgi:hypothetical protein